MKLNPSIHLAGLLCAAVLIAAPLALTAQAKPAASPSAKPSARPSASPSASPSAKPSAAPKPSSAPAAKPSAAPSAKGSQQPTPKGDPLLANQPEGLYAALETSAGRILLSIDFLRCPAAAAAFVGLAEGTVKNEAKPGAPFYDGQVFHRVVSKANGDAADFIIQAGDPGDTGKGGPGFSFAGEYDPALNFDAAGMLALANDGAGGNGSQFFITLAPAPELDQRYAIFGKVAAGLDIAQRIKQGDTITKVTILRKGKDAEAFKPDTTSFETATQGIAERNRRRVDEALARLLPNPQTNEAGLRWFIDRPGTGAAPLAGQTAQFLYTARFLSGRVFDGNADSGQPASVKLGTGRVMPGLDQSLLEMKVGEKRRVLIPPALGFGSEGLSGVVPPDAWLLVDLELVAMGN